MAPPHLTLQALDPCYSHESARRLSRLRHARSCHVPPKQQPAVARMNAGGKTLREVGAPPRSPGAPIMPRCRSPPFAPLRPRGSGRRAAASRKRERGAEWGSWEARINRGRAASVPGWDPLVPPRDGCARSSHPSNKIRGLRGRASACRGVGFGRMGHSVTPDTARGVIALDLVAMPFVG